MYAEARRPSGPGCPPELGDAKAWAQSVPSWLIDIWSATVYGRLQLGPVLLLLALDPLSSSILAAEAVLYITVRVLRGDCTVSGVAAEDARATRTLLGYLRPMLPADLIPVVDGVLAVLEGNASVVTLCPAARALVAYLPDETVAALPLPPCPPAPTGGLTFVRDPTLRGLPGAPQAPSSGDETATSSQGSPVVWVVAALGAVSAAAAALALAMRRRRRRERQ